MTLYYSSFPIYCDPGTGLVVSLVDVVQQKHLGAVDSNFHVFLYRCFVAYVPLLLVVDVPAHLVDVLYRYHVVELSPVQIPAFLLPAKQLLEFRWLYFAWCVSIHYDKVVYTVQCAVRSCRR